MGSVHTGRWRFPSASPISSAVRCRQFRKLERSVADRTRLPASRRMLWSSPIVFITSKGRPVQVDLRQARHAIEGRPYLTLALYVPPTTVRPSAAYLSHAVQGWVVATLFGIAGLWLTPSFLPRPSTAPSGVVFTFVPRFDSCP